MTVESIDTLEFGRMVPESPPHQPSPALPNYPCRPRAKIGAQTSNKATPWSLGTPHKYQEERNHITKQLLPLAEPRPVGAVARVYVIARLRDRLFIKPVRLV